MDFNETPEQTAFRGEARAWLEANAERKNGKRSLNRRVDSERGLEVAKAWQAKKAAAGFACVHFPEEYGGRGMPILNNILFEEEESDFDVPQGYFGIGLGMCAPVMMHYATEEQKRRFLPKLISGEEIWCQLFSEPGAGSDLAGLRCRAQRDGDEWVVNGQKIWTSGAHYSDYGILVTRHDPTLPKHKGLTFFFVDMKSPGIEARPIRQITGSADFNEVFFTNVRIPDSQRLGEVGEGWQVSLTTLMNERVAVGGNISPDVGELLGFVRALEIDGAPALADRAVRDRLADWYVESEGLRLNAARIRTALSRGDTPGPEASISKVVSAVKTQDISDFALDLLAQSGAVMSEGQGGAESVFSTGFLYAPGMRIAGGTDEILRNIIAERVLGLPGDIRVDRDKPFTDVPSGS
ncbi:MAG: acyl-CoA dehydrogenase family protein [Thermoanaerobaculia bacterium]|nr:acyl-CoA dehydrogenase family protein [Thermoanaerobaculia bacterium]